MNLVELDKLLNDVYSSIRPVSTDYDTRKDLMNRLNAMALDIFEDSCPVLEAYGSFVMDTFLPKSDLDVSINFGNRITELPRWQKVEILKKFADKLQSLEGQGIVRNVLCILSARVPIVRFFDKGTGIDCDLSVNGKVGILHSQIIRIISQIDDRFQKLCLLVKHWAKAHEINSAAHQTLNSLSITLLVAHHLQIQNPPILPPFSTLFEDGIDPPNVEKRTQKFLNWGRRNEESLARLFASFFIKLQSVRKLRRQGLCVSVLQGHLISNKSKQAFISIEDFTDVSQNVARRVSQLGAKKINKCINRTVDDISEFFIGNVTGDDLTHKLFSQQDDVESPPPVSLLNVQIAETVLKHCFFDQQSVVEPPLIAATDLKHSFFDQKAVEEPPPAVLPLNGYPQKPREKNYRNKFNGLAEEHHNKRVCLEKGYRAVGGTSQRGEEMNKIPRRKRNRLAGNWNGFAELREIYGKRQVPVKGTGEEPMPVSLWHDYSRRFDLPPPPPPPYDKVYYETWSSKFSSDLFL